MVSVIWSLSPSIVQLCFLLCQFYQAGSSVVERSSPVSLGLYTSLSNSNGNHNFFCKNNQ